MTGEDPIKKIHFQLQEGIRLAKCRKCGCMEQALKNICSYLFSPQTEDTACLLENAQVWLKQTEPTEYACLGCDYCFAATAINILNRAFPETVQGQSLSCDFEEKEHLWPVVPGEYFVLCEDTTCPVAVSTLASIELAESLAHVKPKGLCIVGKTETENIGIDKIIKNVITNAAIRFLVVAGKEPQGHHSGKTLLALSEKGVGEDMNVIDAPGKHPVLRNVCISEVESFRRQVELLDMIGCDDTKMVINKIDELSKKTVPIYESKQSAGLMSFSPVYAAPKVVASEPKKLKMDRSGYFVVIPSRREKTIIVEHYGYDNKLMHIVEGKQASDIYSTIIESGWVTELSHAAYLGKELAKAELSLKHGFKYVQDKAAGRIEDSTE